MCNPFIGIFLIFGTPTQGAIAVIGGMVIVFSPFNVAGAQKI